GLADPDEVAAAVRAQQASAVILDEVASAPPGSAMVLLGPDPARRGSALASYARGELKKKRVAVLVDRRDARCSALEEAFTAAWRKGGGRLRAWQVEDGSKQPALKSEVGRFEPEVVLAAAPASGLGGLAGLLPPVAVLYGGPDEDEEVLARRAASL